MRKTTIAIPQQIKQEIKEFGIKGESYADILSRLIESAKQRQLQDLLMNEKDTISIEKALHKAKKKWQK